MFDKLVIVGIVSLLLLAFAPTRAVLAWIISSNGPVMKILTKIGDWAAAVLTTIYRDHLLILKNFAPRAVVIKTLVKKD